jgi:hypothetical protein
MFGLFSSLGSYYYISVPLQILAIIHAIKTGRRQWIYLLIFIPLIGVVVYFFMEVLPDLRRGGLSANFQKYFFPNQRINEWTRKVWVSDNITNKLGLSNAYAERGQYEKAIELASGCLKGLYADDPGIFLQLARQLFTTGSIKKVSCILTSSIRSTATASIWWKMTCYMCGRWKDPDRKILQTKGIVE